MKTKLHLLVTGIAAWCVVSVGISGPGKGKGSGHGGMPDEFRAVIHALFANHDDFTREVELTDTGYRAKTVSKNREKAALLQKHVAQMDSRLAEGRGVRQWDPAFAEMRRHYADMKIAVEKIEGGVAVDVSGKTPEAIAVARNHAKIITGFIEKGSEQMHAKHPAVVVAADSDSDSEVDPGSSSTVPKCESCNKGKKCKPSK